MPTLYLTEARTLVRRDSEDCLLVEIPAHADADGTERPAVKKRVPLVKVEEVVVLGEVTLTASAIALLLERQVEIHYLSATGRYRGQLSPGLTKNALLRLAQHQAHHQPARRAEVAARFALGKLANQRTQLRRHQRRQDDPQLVAGIDGLGTAIARLLEPRPADGAPPRLVTGDTGISGTAIETILGWEGAGSAAYFGAFAAMLAEPERWSFAGRVKRPPTDPINALLSFGYSLLTTQASAAVQIVGFDPAIGFLHSAKYGRPALALDVMEEFRPLIVDSVVLTLVNNRQISPADFSAELGSYRLRDEPRRLFLTRFEERLNETLTHPQFGAVVSYRRALEIQARLLAKWLTGEIDAYPPLVAR